MLMTKLLFFKTKVEVQFKLASSQGICGEVWQQPSDGCEFPWALLDYLPPEC